MEIFDCICVTGFSGSCKDGRQLDVQPARKMSKRRYNQKIIIVSDVLRHYSHTISIKSWNVSIRYRLISGLAHWRCRIWQNNGSYPILLRCKAQVTLCRSFFADDPYHSRPPRSVMIVTKPSDLGFNSRSLSVQDCQYDVSTTAVRH